MTTIDFSDADDHGRLAREPLNVEINALIERRRDRRDLPRIFLGREHRRARMRAADPIRLVVHSDAAGRVRPIFDRGHFFEAGCGANASSRPVFLFAPPEALAFIALDGLLQGHADGVVIAGPALPRRLSAAFPCVWECKALNAKNFVRSSKTGSRKSFRATRFRSALPALSRQDSIRR